MDAAQSARHTNTDEGWRQILAGISLVEWSRLAHWDDSSLSLAASAGAVFEGPDGHAQVDSRFGRLICWLAFSVGTEYLCKGVCLLHGRKVYTSGTELRSPRPGEDIQAWAALVNAKDESVKVSGVSSQTLAQPRPETIIEPGNDRDLVAASIQFLASAIRNRDAHRYEANVRALNFSAVGALIVPSLNHLLATLDQHDLRQCLATTKGP